MAKSEGNETVTTCHALKMISADGKNANKQANGQYQIRGNYYHFLLLGESQANLFKRAPKNGEVIGHCKSMLGYSGSMPLEVKNQSEDAK